ncbi:MAG: pantoate--beta-alanine ligase [Thermodesulfobacteriota bacterium]
MSDLNRPLIITNSSELQSYSESLKINGKKIAFVPTMGALHKGHLSLVSKANEIGDVTVVSIFVNPTQFGENEDFERYTRDPEGDFDKLSGYKVDVIFTPEHNDIYPDGFKTYVEVTGLQDCMCGLHRPGHFRGVTTVVLKLFNIVKPDYAVFGQKDFQQLKIVEKMVKDLKLEIEIVPMPIIREEDGLALSSRNKYLTKSQRAKALILSKALFSIQQNFEQGCKDVSELINIGKKILTDNNIESIEYIDIRDSGDLSLIQNAESGNLVALAVRIGETRLIDNIML